MTKLDYKSNPPNYLLRFHCKKRQLGFDNVIFEKMASKPNGQSE
jgi:hypothetical protein